MKTTGEQHQELERIELSLRTHLSGPLRWRELHEQLDHLESFLVTHFQHEEDSLYPESSADTSVVASLREDHAWLKRYVRMLRDLAAKKSNEENVRGLLSAILEFLTEHEASEDTL